MSKPEGVLSSRRKKVLAALAYVIVGVMTTLLLAGLKPILEHWSWWHENELWTFGKLESSLSGIDPENPVVLIDISDVRGGKPEEPTPRDKLKEIIQALVELEQRPHAIAVDVEFSPKPNEFRTEADPDFFDFCLYVSNKKKVPIFLAVGERKGAPPEAWLGQEEYKELAAAVAVDGHDTRKMPLWVRAKGASEELKTLSYALAIKYMNPLPLPGAPRRIEWAVDQRAEGQTEKELHEEGQTGAPILTYADRLVNYSKLDSMKLAARKDTSAASVKNTGIGYAHKLVILGDVSKPSDFFPVPGRQLNEGGTVLLACATYTLIKEPLFEFNGRVLSLLDFLIAGIIILMVAVIRYRNPDNLTWIGKQARFIYVAIIVVVLAGFLLVRMAGVIWLDFRYVAFALLLHPKLERLIHRIWEKRKKSKQSGQHSQPNRRAEGVILLLAAIFVGTSTVQAQNVESPCPQRIAAVALGLRGKRGTCYFRDNKDAQWHRLSAADAGKKQFRAGQHLYCDKGCSIVLRLCGTGEEYIVNKNAPKWYSILNAYSSPIWIDSYKDLPVRSSKFFRPADPSTQVAARAMKTSRRFGGLGAIIGGISPATVAEATGRTKPTPSPDPTLAARSPEEEKKQAAEKELEELEGRFTTLLGKGNDARHDNNYDASKQFYADAVNLKPDDWRALYGLGNVYFDQGNRLEAEQTYRRALLLNPYYAEIYLSLGFVLLQPREGVVSADSLAQAETYFWRAATLDPRNEKAYDLLDTVLEKRLASTAEVEGAYRRAVGLNPSSVNVNLRLSKLLPRNGRVDEADKYLRRAQELASRSPELLAVAETLESQRRYKRAERMLRRALVLNATEPPTPFSKATELRAWYILGRVQMLRKHHSEAVQSLKRAANESPESFAPRYLLGMAELRAGSLPDAEHTFEQAATKVRDGTDDMLAVAYGLASIGDSYEKAERLSEAIRLYEKAQRYDPADPETSDKLSEARIRLRTSSPHR